MPFTGNKSPGAKQGSDEWQCDNFTNIFGVKRTFTYVSLEKELVKVQFLTLFASNRYEKHLSNNGNM